jgi:hypothetical protein
LIQYNAWIQYNRYGLYYQNLINLPLLERLEIYQFAGCHLGVKNLT